MVRADKKMTGSLEQMLTLFKGKEKGGVKDD